MRLKPALFRSIRGRLRRRLIVNVFIAGTILGALTLLIASMASALAPGFPDVPNDNPYRVAITDLASRGIITGYTNGYFGPGDAVTRQQFAKMIVLTCGYPVSELDVCPFLDVEWSGLGSLYPDNYVAVAAKHGVTVGKTAFGFAPMENVRRFQVITMVVRAADDLNPSLLDEPPAGYASTWDPGLSVDHGPSARRAQYNGLLDGLQLEQLDPWAAMPRGEVAQVLHNLLRRMDTGTTTTQPPLNPVDIADLKGLDWKNFLGQQVLVQGVFVRDPLPMLVTETNAARANMPMPADDYLLLTGSAAEALDPAVYGGKTLRVLGRVSQAGPATSPAAASPQEPKGGAPLNLSLSDITFSLWGSGPGLSPHVYPIPIEYNSAPDQHKYAILFAGSVDYQNAHIRYWNDLKFMYSTLVGPLGFPRDHVKVLYADGMAQDLTLKVDSSATKADLSAAFQSLRNSTTKDDLIFVFFSNHGGGFNKGTELDQRMCGGAWDANGDEVGETISESAYHLDLNGDGDTTDTVSWDEELCAWQSPGGTYSILDDELRAMMSGLSYDRLVMLTGTCFGGGLIHDVAQGGGRRILMSSASENEPSWSRDDLNFCEFSCNFTSALRGEDPEGNVVNADTNHDGKASVLEAYNYARAMVTAPETPWYEDSGDGVPHAGAMPAQGEGGLGAVTWLED